METLLRPICFWFGAELGWYLSLGKTGGESAARIATVVILVFFSFLVAVFALEGNYSSAMGFILFETIAVLAIWCFLWFCQGFDSAPWKPE